MNSDQGEHVMSTLLISVKPRFASTLLEGIKSVELRRTRPRQVEQVLLYEASPTMALVGGFAVDGMLGCAPSRLWAEVGKLAAVTRREFRTYFSGASVGWGILASNPWRYRKPIALSDLRELWPGFVPPQSYRYPSPAELSALSRVPA